jgi:hypothetical protein
MNAESPRNISILEYFKILQLEYLLYELRTKIYPFKRDKEKYKKVVDFKIDKINNIAEKNSLTTIFDDDEKRKSIEKEFYTEFGVPINLSKRDKYFYYYIGSDFSYKGDGVKLIHYNFDENIATIEMNNEEIEVNLHEIKRIL